MTAVSRLRRALKNSRRPELVVSERGGVRALHLGGEAVQSAMRLDDPYALALDYTRCMMAFLLFHPEPREALLIGLGGGSLAKFLHRELRSLRMRIVEIDPRVIDAARTHFHLPPDDARFAVELGCGAEVLAPECCDLLVVDGFVDEAVPASLASPAFFDAAWMALAEPGVLVMNPPYGERIGEEKELRSLYRTLGEVIRTRCQGWRAFVFTGNPRLAREIGLAPAAQTPFYNGKIPCRLLRFDLP